ncbi:hypothetical protein RND81_14G107800 [Saponaria officinalis]|uniref:Endonuclease/exonuclease/phosphatase domain-containing protein n=1 Tax=Saponaria officinalis TaxID=3572 RepID=A0AAW1GNP7_SAPOF
MLFTYKTTTLKARLSFARVLVEVDVSAPLPTEIVLNNPFTGVHVQEIAYEWVPYFCSYCKKLGHQTANCKKNKPKDVHVPAQASYPSEDPPIVLEGGSGSQKLGGTSAPNGLSSMAQGQVVRSECHGLGSSSSPISHEMPVEEALMHSVRSVPGHSSTHQVVSSLGDAGVVSLQSRVGLLGSAHQDIITANSFSALGCNDPLKAKEVSGFIRAEALDVLGLLETQVRKAKAVVVMGNVCSSYKVVSNYDFHSNGRIWVILNPVTVTVTPLVMHSQFIHCLVRHHSSSLQSHVTFVYASNAPAVRLLLWESLCQISNTVLSWVILGDFNVVRDVSERISDHPPNLSEILDFNACILHCGLEDMQSTGCDYSWTNKQEGSRVWSKLDRVLVNSTWLAQFPSSSAKVMPSGISDHSPILVTLFEDVRPRKRFSFLNCWVQDPSYNAWVRHAWETPVTGSPMF